MHVIHYDPVECLPSYSIHCVHVFVLFLRTAYQGSTATGLRFSFMWRKVTFLQDVYRCSTSTGYVEARHILTEPCTTLHERNGKLCPSRILTETISPLDRILRTDNDNLYFDKVLTCAMCELGCILCVCDYYLYSYRMLTNAVCPLTSVVHLLDHILCARHGNLLSSQMLSSVVRPLYQRSTLTGSNCVCTSW
jgi:hypothetical protein